MIELSRRADAAGVPCYFEKDDVSDRGRSNPHMIAHSWSFLFVVAVLNGTPFCICFSVVQNVELVP